MRAVNLWWSGGSSWHRTQFFIHSLWDKTVKTSGSQLHSKEFDGTKSTLSYVNNNTAKKQNAGTVVRLSVGRTATSICYDRLKLFQTAGRKTASRRYGGTNYGRSVTYRWIAGHTGRPAGIKGAVLSRNWTFLQQLTAEVSNTSAFRGKEGQTLSVGGGTNRRSDRPQWWRHQTRRVGEQHSGQIG